MIATSTLALLGGGLSAAATLGQGIIGGIAGQQQGEYQQKQYEANARIAETQAEDATSRGDAAASAYDKKAKQIVGAQRAAYAGGGVDVNSGSAALIQDETQSIATRDMATIKNNAWREAWGYKVQASNMVAQGGMARAAGDLTFGTSLLTGGLQAAGTFTKSYADSKKA